MSNSQQAKEIAYYTLHKQIISSNTVFQFNWCLQGVEQFLQTFNDADNYEVLINQIKNSNAYKELMGVSLINEIEQLVEISLGSSDGNNETIKSIGSLLKENGYLTSVK